MRARTGRQSRRCKWLSTKQMPCLASCERHTRTPTRRVAVVEVQWVAMVPGGVEELGVPEDPGAAEPVGRGVAVGARWEAVAIRAAAVHRYTSTPRIQREQQILRRDRGVTLCPSATPRPLRTPWNDCASATH